MLQISYKNISEIKLNLAPNTHTFRNELLFPSNIKGNVAPMKPRNIHDLRHHLSYSDQATNRVD